jgi:hypothetical protein
MQTAGNSDFGPSCDSTVSRMNPEVKARWVAALRSGEYMQVKGHLRMGDGMCCLGVLCDLRDSAQWQTTDEHGEHFAYGGGCQSQTGLPPQDVLAWAEFPAYPKSPSRQIPCVTIGDRRAALDEHNDNGRTFAEIADAIEAQL